jgi:DtxR family Mn-dependent transcriptional regulator
MTYIGAAMTPLKSRIEEELEQALGVLWQLKARGETSEEKARAEVAARVSREAFGALLTRGLLGAADGRFDFSGEGETLARDVTRGHLLGERLLADVLDIRGPSLDANACQWEHILSNEVARSICVLLGHPKTCPHGEEIPDGDCCRSEAEALAPLMCPLSGLEPGAEGRIAYLALPDASLLHRLMSLGLVPGTRVRLKQDSPAVIVQVEESLVALEHALASAIFVRRI